MRRMTKITRQRGFTLVELMAVVAIIGIVVTTASVYLRTSVRPIDVANRVGDLVRDASEQAVAMGPVRADVAVALGSRARTRIRGIAGTAPDFVPTFVVERLQEDAAPLTSSQWLEMGRYTVDIAIVAESFSNGVGAHGALPLVTDWSTFSALCYPDGTCQSRTLYLQYKKAGPTSDNFARVSIMPLGGAIMTRKDWN